MRRAGAVLALALGAAAFPVPDDTAVTVLQPGESSLERDKVRGGRGGDARARFGARARVGAGVACTCVCGRPHSFDCVDGRSDLA